MSKKVTKYWAPTYYSSSKWETSYYGGYYNLINDHPDVQLSYKLDVKVKDTMGLSWWTGDKLMKIFLLKVKELGLDGYLADTAKETEVTSFWVKKKVLMVTPEALAYVFADVCKAATEHKALFENYSKLIKTCEISIPLPPPGGGGSSGGEDEQEDEGEGEGQKGDKGGAGANKEKGGQSGKGTPEGKGQGKSEEGEGKEKGKGKGGEGDGDETGDSDTDGEGKDNGKRDSKRGEGTLKNGRANRTAEIQRAKGDLRAFLGEIKKREIQSFHLNGNLVKETKFIHPKDRQKCRFSDDEYAFAARLVKLLDINFDPAVDRINSLRMGKLDPRKVAEVIPGNMNVYYTHEENQTTKPFSVVILQDESGSMSEHYKIDYSKSILKTLYLAFSEILPQDKIYVYGHSGDNKPEVFVYQDKYNQKFEERIESVDSRDSNYDGPAIESVYEKVRGMTDDNIIFITLSDGQPCGCSYGGGDAKDNMKKVLEKCRRDGFVTVGLGILHFNDPTLYNYSCVIKSLGDEMIKKTSHIINKVVKTEFQ